MDMKKIGFLGGTFDPVHFGHLNLAMSLLEMHQLDEVIFSPAHVSPHKISEPPLVSGAHRLRMTELAIAPIAQFSLYDKEVERGGSSFTIDTIRSLVEKSKQAEEKVQYYLLLGEDALPSLHRWKAIDELFALAPPLVGCRGENFTLTASILPPMIAKLIEEGWTEIPLFSLSSSMLRKRLKKRLYCGHLMPVDVLDYIYENELYL
jgi:nicotinate-nucleotide adenylyltransferase